MFTGPMALLASERGPYLHDVQKEVNARGRAGGVVATISREGRALWGKFPLHIRPQEYVVIPAPSYRLHSKDLRILADSARVRLWEYLLSIIHSSASR